jgi:RDD family
MALRVERASILSLRVVGEDGSPIYLGAAFLRNVLRLVDGLFFYLVAAVSVWASPTRQRLGDRAAHTYVVLDNGSIYPRRASELTEWRPPPESGGTVPIYSEGDFRSDLARAGRLKSRPSS